MINFGSIYLISKDFESSVKFYKELLEKDVVAQNMNRFAVFDVDGFSLSIMNGYFDIENPEKVETKGERYDEYDSYAAIADRINNGKIVINLGTDNLQKEYDRIVNLGIGKNLTQIRYINAKNPYYYFSLKDPDENIIEVTGVYDEVGNV